MRFRRITIVQAPLPRGRDVNEQLQWLGGSLGLFNPRDKDKSCFRIFITLLKSAKRSEELSSDELAERTGLSRGTVVHHLNRLMGTGLVETYRSRYVLRVDNLDELVARLDDDLQKTMAMLREIAGEIDRKLGP
jgi:DNA-binding transcriptional ArsR family regulator